MITKVQKILAVDSGVNTALCLLNVSRETLQIELLKSYTLYESLKITEQLINTNNNILIAVEDARLCKIYNKDFQRSVKASQGVGSVKRDAKIWEEFFNYHNIKEISKDNTNNISYKFINPLNVTLRKASKDTLIRVYKNFEEHLSKTNQHARDAFCIAMTVANNKRFY